MRNTETKVNVMNVLDDLESLKQAADCDIIKVYFESKQSCTVKLIKDEKMIDVYRKGRGSFDLKKQEK